MYKLWVSLFIAGIILQSCNKKTDCSLAEIDCMINTTIGFKIEDKLTGEDLVFNTTTTYSRNDLKLYSISSKDTTFYTHYAYAGFNGIPDSTLLTNLSFPWPEKLYIRLTDQPTDSLAIRYFSKPVTCGCPVFYIESLQLNKDTIMRDRKNLVILKK